MGVIIEHYAGVFPLWLSPVQVKIISVAEAHIPACEKLALKLRQSKLRVEIDDSNETVGNKIRKAANEKVPYTLVVGDKEAASSLVAVRDRGQKETREMELIEFIEEAREKIAKKA